MSARKEIQREHYKRYQKGSKKEKGKILDDLVGATGQNRDYLAHVLANYGKTRYGVIEGKRVKFVSGKGKKRRSGGGRPKQYDERFVKTLEKLWGFFDGECAKRLIPLIRSAIDFLEASVSPNFGIDSKIRELLLRISISHADRLLKPARKKAELRGKSTTKSGTLLKNQIPVRTFFRWDERKPGFFEIDRVAHCGTTLSGEFCWTLTATDIYSGWTEERALLNNAQRWAKEGVEDIKAHLPFAMYGIDSDNGGEFINHQLFLWCKKEEIEFTRGRPYRKNDNCFVEQKNGDRVRKTVGYFRYDTDGEYEALGEVYRFLNLFTNYWQPSIKISEKTRLENGKYQKKYEKAKTPCQRLLECQEIPEGVKTVLRETLKTLNPVDIKKALDKAVDKLVALHLEKARN
jgi:hypothetical protein